MSNNYRVIVYYQFKHGMEEQGIHFLERELVHKGKDYGCHYIEIWQNEKDPSHVEGIAVWRNIEDARKFQAKWEKKENELISHYCVRAPKREFCKIRGTYSEQKMKKAA